MLINSLVEIQIPRAINVRIEEALFYVQLEDGREIGGCRQFATADAN